MPTNASTRLENSADSSQERILAEATRLFLLHGYEKTSIDEIGVAAGLSGPAIYYHFRSKSDLLLRVVDRAQESSIQVTTSLLDPHVDPLDALSLMVAAWVDDSFRNRALILTYTHEHPHLDQEIRSKLGAKYRTITDMWMVVLARLRPELPEAERLAMVDSAFWLIRSQAFYPLYPPDSPAVATTPCHGARLPLSRRRSRRARRRRCPHSAVPDPAQREGQSEVMTGPMIGPAIRR